MSLSISTLEVMALINNNFGDGNNNRPIEIHLHNEICGREFQTVIKKVPLEDIGLQV